MSKRLFVGGLSYNVTSPQLGELFAKYGTVTSADVISDKFSGRSKGFAFVDMEVDEEADKAIKELDGTEFEGRKIVVNVARPREERPSYNNDRRSGGNRY